MKPEDFLNNSKGDFECPVIPDKVYRNLPDILSDATKPFIDEREKDLVLLASLGVLSGLFPTVYGKYRGEKAYSNLFIFISAPPANKKGSMNWARRLGDKYHNELKAKFKIEKQEYDESLRKKKNESASNSITLAPPVFKMLFIPADNSSASIVQNLSNNDGWGILFESEADTLSATFKSEWGDYSDKLRKAFHHERISFSRKTNAEFYEVDEPRLSVILSGTPNQIKRLIPSSENGLFSRFIFYAFNSKPEWEDVSSSAKINLEDHFNNLGDLVFKLIVEYKNQEVYFDLQDHQWNSLNKFFKQWLAESTKHLGDETASGIFRLGLITFKLAMILTVVRNESGIISNKLICNRIDFDTAMRLTQIIKEHNFSVFSELPKEGGIVNKDNLSRKRFFEGLPDNFERMHALNFGINKHGLSERTVGNYLNGLVSSKLLFQPKYGYYSKANKVA